MSFCSGDLYGGAHYSQSCSAALTPQGRAIQAASVRFGDGKTLPFTPCKKGYLPFHSTSRKKMYACPLHDVARRERLQADNFVFRHGEVDLNMVFWSQVNDPAPLSPRQQSLTDMPQDS